MRISKPNTSHKRASVFIVDDLPLVRDWLSRLINEETNLKVCGWADNADDAVREITRLKPGISIIDIGLRGKSGLELIRLLTKQNPEEIILVFSAHDEATYAKRAYQAGARGYVSKLEATENIVVALNRILGGGMYVSETFAEAFAKELTHSKSGSLPDDVTLLSDRELEIFRLLASGRGTSEIAQELSISLKTVHSYCSRIKVKLNLRNATELLQAATRWADAHVSG